MKSEDKMKKKFELVQLSALFSLVLLIIYYFRDFKEIEWVYAAMGFLLIGVLFYWLLLPLHKFWFWLAKTLSSIVTPIIFGVLFYVFLTPIAFLRRIFGKQVIQRKFEDKESFWTVRKKTLITKEDFEHQF